MPPRKTARRIIRSEARQMIAKVYHYLQEEYIFMKNNNNDNCDLSPLANVSWRTAEATGVSMRTVSKILKEERELKLTNGQFVSPTRKRRKKDDHEEFEDIDSESDDDSEGDDLPLATTSVVLPIVGPKIEPESEHLNTIVKTEPGIDEPSTSIASEPSNSIPTEPSTSIASEPSNLFGTNSLIMNDNMTLPTIKTETIEIVENIPSIYIEIAPTIIPAIQIENNCLDVDLSKVKTESND